MRLLGRSVNDAEALINEFLAELTTAPVCCNGPIFVASSPGFCVGADRRAARLRSHARALVQPKVTPPPPLNSVTDRPLACLLRPGWPDGHGGCPTASFWDEAAAHAEIASFSRGRDFYPFADMHRRVVAQPTGNREAWRTDSELRSRALAERQASLRTGGCRRSVARARVGSLMATTHLLVRNA